MSVINFTFNFHASVGQNIAHVDHLECHFDKDTAVQVIGTKEMSSSATEENKHTSSSEILLSSIELLMSEKKKDGKYLFYRGNHWIAVFRIVVDRKLGVASTDYTGFCDMINRMKPNGFRIPLKQENLKKINEGGFDKPFCKWKYDSTYHRTRRPFDTMVLIATRFQEILEENGL